MGIYMYSFNTKSSLYSILWYENWRKIKLTIRTNSKLNDRRKCTLPFKNSVSPVAYLEAHSYPFTLAQVLSNMLRPLNTFLKKKEIGKEGRKERGREEKKEREKERKGGREGKKEGKFYCKYSEFCNKASYICSQQSLGYAKIKP